MTAAPTTKRFTVHPRERAKAHALHILRKAWWLAAAVSGTLLTAACFDWRWLVAFLALSCLIAPTLLMFGWFAIALHPDAVAEMHPHSLSLSSQGLQVNYFTDDSGASVPPSFTIHFSSITQVATRGKYLIIYFTGAGNETRQLFLPTEAFASPQQAATFCENIYKTLATTEENALITPGDM